VGFPDDECDLDATRDDPGGIDETTGVTSRTTPSLSPFVYIPRDG